MHSYEEIILVAIYYTYKIFARKPSANRFKMAIEYTLASATFNLDMYIVSSAQARLVLPCVCLEFTFDFIACCAIIQLGHLP